ncbi:MAG: hypothetical protein AAGE94_16340 [Acidobacteriota bacterium]
MTSTTPRSARDELPRRRRATISLFNIGTGLFWIAIGVFVAGLFGFVEGRIGYWALLCAGLIALILAQVRRRRARATSRSEASDLFAPPPRSDTPIVQEIAGGVVLSLFVTWLMKSSSPEIGLPLAIVAVVVAALLQPDEDVESVVTRRRISAMEAEVQAELARARTRRAHTIDRSTAPP